MHSKAAASGAAGGEGAGVGGVAEEAPPSACRPISPQTQGGPASSPSPMLPYTAAFSCGVITSEHPSRCTSVDKGEYTW